MRANSVNLNEVAHYELAHYEPPHVALHSLQIKLLMFKNLLTTEKQKTKFSSANFQKILNPSYIILRIQRLEGKQCRSR